MSLSKSEIESLVFLLDDPDEFVKKSVTDRLYQIGEASIPMLDEIRSKTGNKDVKSELLEIIHSITFDGFQQEFINLLDNGIYTMDDLEEAVFLISRIDDPTMRTRRYKEQLDQIAADIKPEIRRAGTMKAKMNLLLNYLYKQKGFEGCHSDYLSPRHSYLHHVIENKIGIPLSLALVILFLAKRLGLPFYGVNMPLHFLVRFQSEGEQEYLIDPFNNGGFLTRDQCIMFLNKSGIKPTEAHFKNARETEMLKRFIRNLINGYQQQKDTLRGDALLKLLALLETSRV